MRASKSRGQLLHAWEHNGIRYRLVAVGKFTAGYEDEIRVEKAVEDSLGGDCWITTHTVQEGDAEAHWRDVVKPLVNAIKDLKSKVGQSTGTCEP